MRVVIEVVAGPLAGRRFHLVRNQRLEVGSTARADVCIRDSNLAAQHFALETDLLVCRIRDLSGQAGTVVNGQAIEEAVLSSGDQVQAGASRFIIHVEGAVAPPDLLLSKPARPPGKAAARRASEARFAVTACDTGLSRYSGSCLAFPPGELAAELALDWPLYLLADNRRLADEALAVVRSPHYLFDWLGESAAAVSPLVIGPDEIPEPAGLIGRGFGKDGLVAFFARAAGPGIVAALRAAVRLSPDRVIGICWPRILAHLLRHHDPAYVKQLMQPFVCVLLEDPLSPENWQLFSAESLEPRLQALGLQPASPAA